MRCRFCWYASLSILMDWALQLSFFLACFVLTERRIEASRYDFLCCFQRAPAATLAAAQELTDPSDPSTVRTAFPLVPLQAVRNATETASNALAAEVRPTPPPTMSARCLCHCAWSSQPCA